MDKELPFNETELPRLLAEDLKRYWDQFAEYYWQFVTKEAYRLTRSDDKEGFSPPQATPLESVVRRLRL